MNSLKSSVLSTFRSSVSHKLLSSSSDSLMSSLHGERKGWRGEEEEEKKEDGSETKKISFKCGLTCLEEFLLWNTNALTKSDNLTTDLCVCIMVWAVCVCVYVYVTEFVHFEGDRMALLKDK